MVKRIHIKKWYFEYTRIGGVSYLSIFKLKVFKRVGEMSLLFDIDWSQRNGNYTSWISTGSARA